MDVGRFKSDIMLEGLQIKERYLLKEIFMSYFQVYVQRCHESTQVSK